MIYRGRSNERELFDLRTSSDRTKGQVQRSPSDDLFSQLTVAGLSSKTLPPQQKLLKPDRSKNLTEKQSTGKAFLILSG